MNADVSIVGAGPGGALAAQRLAASGLRVMILEKERLPRHKACGGGLSPSVKSLFDWDLTPWVENTVTGRKFLFNHTQPYRGRVAPMWVVDRTRFDAHLVERALDSGKGNVALREGFPVCGVTESETGVVVCGKTGERVRAAFLIGADGATGPVARILGLNQGGTRGLAIEAEVVSSPEIFAAEKQTATFNFFCLPHGYGWIFPRREGLLNCGVVAWAGHPRLPEALEEFLARSFPAGKIRLARTYVHTIPLYSGPKAIASRRACLVGDAASLVDPVMGEGIRYAMLSGALAAEVIAGLNGIRLDSATHAVPVWGEGDCRVYQSLIYAGIGQSLEHLRRFIQLVFLGAPDFFYRKVILKSKEALNS